MKKLILTLLLVAAGLSASAEMTECLSVVYDSGNVAMLPLTSVRRIDMTQTHISIVTEAGDPMEVAISDLKRLELKMADYVGITAAELSDMGVGITGGEVKVSGAPADAMVRIYNLTGIEVAAAKCSTTGEAALNLSHLPSGAYVLAINNFTKKFIKR